MKNLKCSLALLLAGSTAIGMMAGCDEKAAAPASGAVVAEEINTVQVDGQTVAKETVVASEEALNPGAAGASIRDPKLWAFLPEVIAEVNGKKITKQEFIDYMAKQVEDGKMPPLMNNPQILVNAAPAMIKSYIDKPLLLAAAEKAGFKPSAELVAKVFKEQFAQASPEEIKQFKEQLAKNEKTMDSFIAEMAADKAIQTRVALEAYMESAVVSKIVVTKEEAQKFYDEHKNYFQIGDAPNTVRASHILIMAKKGATEKEMAEARTKAEQILTQLKADSSQFEALAEKESACPSGKKKGSLGAFGKGEMVKEFEDVAFSLKEGEISGVVQTDFGFHIIRRDKSLPPSVQPFAEVEKDIEGMLKNQMIQKHFAALIENLEKENDVKIFVKPQMPAPVAVAPAADKNQK